MLKSLCKDCNSNPQSKLYKKKQLLQSIRFKRRLGWPERPPTAPYLPAIKTRATNVEFCIRRVAQRIEPCSAHLELLSTRHVRDSREAHHIYRASVRANFLKARLTLPVRHGNLHARRSKSWSGRGNARAVGRDATWMDAAITAGVPIQHKHDLRQVPAGCAACDSRRPGWFCSPGSSVLADLELATSTIALPAQSALFKQGADARCLYLICSGYMKLTAGRADDRRMIVRIAGPGSMLGLYAALSHRVYEVSADSLTTAQLRPVESDRFLGFLRTHKEAQMRALQCICHEYQFALQDACRIALSETVAARLGRLLLEFSHQIGERLESDAYRFPLLLTHEELASMTCTTRETVTRTLGQFRKEGWISIQDALVTVNQPDRLQALI
jgi:CRP/FNR family cyclic AMP-dependent transcriptional regulator